MRELEEGSTKRLETVLLPQHGNVAPLISSVAQLEQTDTGNTVSSSIHAKAIQQAGELEEGPTERLEIAFLPQDSHFSSLVSSVQQSEVDAGNVAPTDTVADLGEHSKYALFVGAPEWTHDPREQVDNHDLYVEVKVGGSRDVYRTMYTDTSIWDQDLKITGYLPSIVSIEIKSGAHNISKSRSLARADATLGNLLESCADGDAAFLELTIPPLVFATIDRATAANIGKIRKHSSPNSVGLLAVKICRLSREPPSVLQPGDTCTLSAPPMSELKRVIPEEVEEDPEISSLKQALALTLDWHPEKPELLSSLGAAYHTRFDRLGDLPDLEISIASLERAVALTAEGHPRKTGRISDLAIGYSARFRRLGNRADLENSIASRQQVLALTQDGHPDKPMYLSNLGNDYYTRFDRFGDLTDLENSITSHEKAALLTVEGHPDKPVYLSNMGNSYRARFGRLGDLADLEKSIARQQQAVALTVDDHPSKAGRLSNLGIGYTVRFKRLGDLADVDNAIASQRQAVALTSEGHQDKPERLSNLGSGYSARFRRLGDLADLDNSIASWQQAVALTAEGHPNKPVYLSNLGNGYRARFDKLGDLPDLENSIMGQQQAVALTAEGRTDKPRYLSNLGNGYRVRFQRLGGVADLHHSITSQQQAVALTAEGHPDKPQYLTQLCRCQHMAGKHYQLESYHNDARSSIQLAAQSLGASPSVVLTAARSWALLSMRLRDLASALQGFRTAIEILPQVAWLGLDIAARQVWLTKEKPEELGCMAAWCAIRLGRFEEAVELLDMARSVFWQQASSVRIGLEDLKAEWPELAEELETVSQKLDASSFSGLSTSDNDTQLHERQLADHRDLVLRRESLIKDIRLLPGFEFFLKPTPFNRLREAVVVGRVIIINISTFGADALVFGRSDPIRHVPLPKVNVAKSLKHTDDIEPKQTRPHGTEDRQHSFKTSLAISNNIDVCTLKPTDGIVQRQARADVTEDRQRSRKLPRVWDNIINPILTKVGLPLPPIQDQVPTNRIFWYLTGPLTFIPIHAAGPVSQLVVSSYVTTLSSLAEAQRRQSEAISGPPMLLAISQPDTPGKTSIPHATAEVNKVTQTVLAAGWPQGQLQRFDRARATVDGVSTALNACSWVHFACHAMQDTSDGMGSGFALHDGRLKLSVIAAKRLALARFAFLSTCESASGLEDSPGEAIHLSAGMQFAGFSSVIATMWSIQDEDAPVIAEYTYGYLLRNGLDKVDLTEAAAALHYAVSRLREDPTVTMERWAPFVYYGV